MDRIQHLTYGGHVYIIESIIELGGGVWKAVGSIGHFEGDEYVAEVPIVTEHSNVSAMAAGSILEDRIKSLIDESNTKSRGLKKITEAWVIDEPTTGDWLKIGLRIDGEEHGGTITRTALTILEGRSSNEGELNSLLIRAATNFASCNPGAQTIALQTPLDFS